MKNILKIALLIIVIDSIGITLPIAYSEASISSLYLPIHEQGKVKVFFQALGFHGFMYLAMMLPIHIFLIIGFIGVSKLFPKSLTWSVIIGFFIAAVFYILYSNSYILNWNFSSSLYYVLWYGLVGAIFGWMYFSFVDLRIHNEK